MNGLRHAQVPLGRAGAIAAGGRLPRLGAGALVLPAGLRYAVLGWLRHRALKGASEHASISDRDTDAADGAGGRAKARVVILSPQHLLHLVTDLGDSILLLPASALVLAYFLYLRSRRAALAWASTVALCIVLTILAKVSFLACGSWVAALDIRSPSGHTSLSCTFYAGTALAVSADKDRLTRLFFAAASTLLVLVIAASRVLLNAHSASEVVTGLAIGAACVWWYWRRRREGPQPAIAWEPLAAGFLALALVLHGLHLTLEGPLTHLAHLLRPTACRSV